MIRSLFALVFALAVLAAAPAAAQPRPTQVPVSVGGATPGINIQFFMDANKLADTTANGTGGVNWVLDLGNLPKTKLTIYVDVCKDGKIVKVMFVSGNGQPPPEDDDCKRRLAALSFQSDCAGVHVNLDFSNFAASNVIGCRISFTNPKVLGTVGGVLVGAIALTAGGGGSTTTSTTATSPPPITSTTTTAAAPPAAPPTQTPSNPTPSPTPAPPVSTVPSTPSADGPYSCAACVPNADPGGHNRFIDLCRFLVSLFSVQGTITISHPAPFVGITGTYNSTTGAFSATGRGTVAGIPNVGVRAEGTVNTTTGRITMIYTMGTGGELPGGQAITYSITLQKQ